MILRSNPRRVPPRLLFMETETEKTDSAQEAAQTSPSLKVYQVHLDRTTNQTWSVLIPAASREEAEAFTQTSTFMQYADTEGYDPHSESDGGFEVDGITETSHEIEDIEFEYEDVRKALSKEK